ncbi:hypothetical protein, partial [Cellulomonas carbonis]
PTPDAVGPTPREVRATVRRLARGLRQADGTTCGSAVLTMLAACGDDGLVTWLATGHVPDVRPPELRDAPESALRRLAGARVEDRAAVLQRILKRRTNARAALGLPWPESLGTPPWGAARVARFPGVRYAHLPVDDTDRSHLDRVLGTVRAWLAAGVPVPLYTGGDTARGWSTAVPRHVVLAVADRPDGGLDVWEPSRGRVVPTEPEALAGRAGPHPGLGGWEHVVWAVLPVAHDGAPREPS